MLRIRESRSHVVHIAAPSAHGPVTVPSAQGAQPSALQNRHNPRSRPADCAPSPPAFADEMTYQPELAYNLLALCAQPWLERDDLPGYAPEAAGLLFDHVLPQ